MSAGCLVAVHQPNFFPWLGYFDKIVRADVFIVLDDVQFARTGSGTWSNRVRVLVNGEPTWMTMPIRRDHDHDGLQRYDLVQIDDTQPWREKCVRTLQTHYRRAAHFNEGSELIASLVRHATQSLVDYNLHATRAIADRLGIDTSRWVRSSTLAVGTLGTDRLIDLVRAVGGGKYLSGDGAGGYQDDDAFARAGLGLVRQQFVHPQYDQGRRGDFVPGLSCIDALMHCGIEGTGELLRAASRRE